MKYFQIDENKQFYKCNITFQPVTVCSPTHASNVKADDLNDEIETEQEKESVKPKFFRSNFEASLNFWCMSPSVVCFYFHFFCKTIFCRLLWMPLMDVIL